MEEKLTDMIFNQPPIAGNDDHSKSVVIPTFFSADERKKMRRLHR